MSGRLRPLAALVALVSLPAALLLSAGDASAADAGLQVDGVPLSGATVSTTSTVDLVSPGATSVSWVLDGRYLGRDTAAPFELELSIDPGKHKLKGRAKTAAGVQTTFEVRFSATEGESAPESQTTTGTEGDTATKTDPTTAGGGVVATTETTRARPATAPAPSLSESVASVIERLVASLRVTTPARSGGPVPAAPVSPAIPVSPATPVEADGPVRAVRTAGELSEALSTARPGEVIELADGTYDGRFVIEASGTEAQPIVLRGGPGAVLNGGATASGYALHLKNADFWRLEGFTVRGAQKGIVLDGSSDNFLSRLDVGSTGMEAVHFRAASSDNRLEDSSVHDTGLVDRGFGEGVYIGSATSNWDKYGEGGGPDRSDRNVVTGNHIYAVTAENLDIKEGTTGGIVSGNTFDGRGMTGDHFADSWIDVKGNGYKLIGNTGVHTPLDGFQTHVQLAGWGRDNVFSGNQLTVQAKGYGINIHKADSSTGNMIDCDNVVVGADKGSANLRCR
ncbi:right-handed parallel beta-helix repeat-containing protein [Modestobacter lapidis]|nr:hypothetical protein [Modestobacter lapidis]